MRVDRPRVDDLAVLRDEEGCEEVDDRADMVRHDQDDASDVREGRGDGQVLFGYASSGTGGTFGKTVRLASRQFSLGQRPKLSYVRRLNLSAAVNILTSANFRVLVEGVPVDEVSAVGMDYEEASWTERVDIDLMRFAGQTVTLTFEVAANSNVFIEVSAKASAAVAGYS